MGRLGLLVSRSPASAATPTRPTGTTSWRPAGPATAPSPAVRTSRSANPPGGGDGSLRFVSDRSGWWQPYLLADTGASRAEPRPLTDVEAEFHGPDWVLGQRTMAETADGTLVARHDGVGPGRASSSSDHATARRPRPPRRAARRSRASPSPPLSAHGDGLALIGSTPDDALQRLGLDPGDGRPAAATAARRALGGADVAVGEPFTLTGRLGARRARHALPADAARDAGPGGQRAAAGHVVPRRPDLGRRRPGSTSTLQFFTTPGLRRGLCRLRGELGVRPGLPLRPVGPVGRRRLGGLPRCGAAPGGARVTSTPDGWPSGAAVRAA